MARYGVETKDYIDVGPTRKIFRRLMGYWIKHWKYSFVVILCLVVVSTLQAMPALLTKQIIDDAIPDGNFSRLSLLALSIVGVTALSGFFGFFQRYLGEIIAQKLVYQLRKETYDSLQRQSFSYFDQTRTGQLMARTTVDVDLIRRFFSFGFRMIAGSLLSFCIVVFICIFVLRAPGLTVLSYTTGPLIVWAMIRYAKKQREPLYTSRELYGSMSSTLQENLTGIQVVTAFDQNKSEIAKFEEKNSEYFGMSILLARIRALYGPLSALLVGISVIIIMLYGGYRVVSGSLTVGTLFSFTIYGAQLTRPLSMLGNMVRIYQDAMAGGRRVFEVIDAVPDVSDKQDAIELGDIEGRITFEDVSFSYSDGSPSLENVSFEVEPGETVILLGGTGSGKSTIINLVPRFYDPVSGTVKIDGQDLRDVRIRSLRKSIGIVPQETFLFSTSIKENIAYGRPDATDEEIIETAKTAEAYDFIQAMPKGFETEVGERGVTLSGGEKQRVAIARALLMDPKILILDDSTSSVDTKTEYQIQKALDALLKNRTTLIITQRLSMLRKGYRIIVLDQGKIVEQGSHDSLIEQNGLYKRIYDAQSGGDFEEES